MENNGLSNRALSMNYHRDDIGLQTNRERDRYMQSFIQEIDGVNKLESLFVSLSLTCVSELIGIKFDGAKFELIASQVEQVLTNSSMSATVMNSKHSRWKRLD